MLAAVHGKSLEDVLAQEIFTPAGMRSSGLITDRRVIAMLPPSYDLDAGPQVPARFPPHQELANYGGAGAAYSTAEDLLAFNHALMNDVLLDRTSREVMLESSPQSGSAAFGCWVYTLEVPGHGSVRVVERHGAIAGYNVVNLIAPDKAISVILLCNISSFAEPQTWGRQGLAYQLLEEALGQVARGVLSPRAN
jgi:CubicO group peptidase (beta-lactamase class C family)